MRLEDRPIVVLAGTRLATHASHGADSRECQLDELFARVATMRRVLDEHRFQDADREANVVASLVMTFPMPLEKTH